MMLILTIVSTLISFLLFSSVFQGYFGMFSMLFSTITGILLLILMLVINIVLAIVMLFIIGWLVATLSRSVFKGTGDVSKTVGFLGYSKIVGFVTGLIMTAIMLLLFGSILSDLSSMSSTYGSTISMDRIMAPPDGSTGSIGYYGNYPAKATSMFSTILLFGIVTLIIGILAFIWELWVGGTGAAVANGISTGAGMVSYFLASLIIIGILVVVGVMIALLTTPLMYAF